MNSIGVNFLFNGSIDRIEVQFSENGKPLVRQGSFRGRDDIVKGITLIDSQDLTEKIQKVEGIHRKSLGGSAPNSPDSNLIGVKSMESFSPGNKILSDSPEKNDEKKVDEKKDDTPLNLTKTGVTFKFDSQVEGEKTIFEALKLLEKSASTDKKIEDDILGEGPAAEITYDVERIKTVINLLISFNEQYPDFDWTSEEKKNACMFLFQRGRSFIYAWKNNDSKENALFPLRHGLFVYYLLCRKLGIEPAFVMKEGKGSWRYFEIVRELVKINGSWLRRACPPLKNSHELVSIALQDSGLNLRFASKEFRADLGTVLKAIEKNPLALEFASDELKSNKEVFSKALEKNVLAVKFVPQELQLREVVLAAVKEDGLVLEFTKNFQGDREIVMEAVKRNGDALEFATDELRNDKEFVNDAHKQNHRSFRKSSPKLRADEKYMLEKVREFPSLIEFASPELQDKEEFVKIATTQDPELIQYASKRIQQKAKCCGLCCEIL